MQQVASLIQLNKISPFRLVRLVFGVFIVYFGISNHQWALAMIGAGLFIHGIFNWGFRNKGCNCGSEDCSSNH